jgi:protein arginine N-methyltransferase 5
MTNSHNTRSTSLTFHIPHAAPCHGLAGYFEAHLYGNVGLSTQPETAHRISPDMTSWFPIFFPFRQPIYLPSGSELEVNMWRLSDNKGKKVWYEWSAESYLPVTLAPGAPGTRPVSASMSGQGNGIALAPTPTGSLNANSRNQLSAPASSPMMDAAYSPTRASFGAVQGQGAPGAGAEGRIKIGQTGLHNVGGVHSWVGL